MYGDSLAKVTLLAMVAFRVDCGLEVDGVGSCCDMLEDAFKPLGLWVGWGSM